MCGGRREEGIEDVRNGWKRGEGGALRNREPRNRKPQTRALWTRL